MGLSTNPSFSISILYFVLGSKVNPLIFLHSVNIYNKTAYDRPVKERSAEVARATKCRGTLAAVTPIVPKTSPFINRRLGSLSTPVLSPDRTAATPVGPNKFGTFSNFAANSFQSLRISS